VRLPGAAPGGARPRWPRTLDLLPTILDAVKVVLSRPNLPAAACWLGEGADRETRRSFSSRRNERNLSAAFDDKF